MLLKNISLLLLLLPSTWLDIKEKKVWIPWLTLFFVEAVIIAIIGINTWKLCLLGMVPGIILLVISLVTNGAIGLGDGYLVCVIGSLIGLDRTLIILAIAMFIAAIAGVVLIVFTKCGRKKTIPFVPFLMVGFLMQICVK